MYLCDRPFIVGSHNVNEGYRLNFETLDYKMYKVFYQKSFKSDLEYIGIISDSYFDTLLKTKKIVFFG